MTGEQEYRIEKAFEELAEAVHKNSSEHGWWDDDVSFPEEAALFHAEISEALEAYRNNEPMFWVNDGKPDGIAMELGDCILRILDWCGKEKIDMGHLLLMKLKYNKTRPWRHGGKKI